MTTKKTIVIFGESKEGEFQKLIFLNTLPDLANKIGEPTETGTGVHMAIQAMLFNHDILFYKVTEEGFSTNDYLAGLKLLEKDTLSSSLAAIALPGVGTSEILNAASSLCALHKSLLIITEKDLYDFMTQS